MRILLTDILFQLSEGTLPTNSQANPLQEQQLQRLSNELEQVRITKLILLNLAYNVVFVQCKSTISRVTAERDRALTEVRQLSNTLHEQEQQYNQQVLTITTNFCTV